MIHKDSSNKIGIALVKELCPICATEVDGGVVINTQLNIAQAKKVEAMHGKVVGVSNKACPSCQEMLNVGGLIIIWVDASKTDDEKNPYRCGQIDCMKREAAIRIFGKEQGNAAVSFVDHRIAAHINTPLNYKSDE